jgi:monovalent cation/hydrogen antiporter
MFFLAGRALPEAFAGLADWPLWRVAGAAAVLLLVVLTVQFAFSLLSTALPPVSAALRRKDGEGAAASPRTATAAVMAWSSSRSVIGLVVALSLPPAMDDRGLVLVVAALLILGSVLAQGLTLRPAVRAAALGEEAEEEREVELATRAANAAAEEAGDEDGLCAARRTLLDLREEDCIGDEVLRKMLREADLKARAAEGPAAALPGAAPPQP